MMRFGIAMERFLAASAIRAYSVHYVVVLKRAFTQTVSLPVAPMRQDTYQELTIGNG